MSVAVHNPSANPILKPSFAVPHGHYKVQAFNKTTQSLEDVSSSVLCNDDNVENGDAIKSCFMHVDLTTYQKDVSVIQLTYDENQDLEAKMNEIQVSNSIQTDQ